jgi:hypothetical protein
MKALAVIDAGTCGYLTSVVATAERGRLARLAVDSRCDTIVALTATLAGNGPFDVFDEMDWRTESRLRITVRESMNGCYAWCPVPVGLFESVQLAAGLTLPRTSRSSCL